MSKEAMKLALEALKNFEKAGLATLKTIDAITAIKEALANDALDKMAENERELGIQMQPEPEAVAWAEALFNEIKHGDEDHQRWLHEKLISWALRNHLPKPEGWGLYTSPPKRKPLTDEEIDNAVWHLGFGQLSPREVARAIEAAHSIKE